MQRVAQSRGVGSLAAEAEVEEGRRECWAYSTGLEEFEAGRCCGYDAGARSDTGTAGRQKRTLVSHSSNTGKQTLGKSHKKLMKKLGASFTTLGS